MSGYRVEKQGYSHGAWRVLHVENDQQVWQNEAFEHPTMGRIVHPGPVCFQRKRDALDWVAARLELEARLEAEAAANT